MGGGLKRSVGFLITEERYVAHLNTIGCQNDPSVDHSLMAASFEHYSKVI